MPAEEILYVLTPFLFFPFLGLSSIEELDEIDEQLEEGEMNPNQPIRQSLDEHVMPSLIEALE